MIPKLLCTDKSAIGTVRVYEDADPCAVFVTVDIDGLPGQELSLRPAQLEALGQMLIQAGMRLDMAAAPSTGPASRCR